MTKLEKQAAQLLEENPEMNTVYMTEDGQAFFNKDAAKNHSRGRKLQEPEGFFRSGVPTPQEELDNAKALVEALEKIKVQESVLETLEKVFTEADHGIEVSPDTEPIVAMAVGLTDQLAEARANDEEQGKALIAAGKEIEDLKKQLEAAKAPAKKK